MEFEFIKGDVFSQGVQEKIRSWASDRKGQYLSVFLAMADQRSNFVMSMNMPDEVYDNQVPVFVRQDRSDNFVTNLRTTDQAKTLTHARYDGKLGKVLEDRRLGRYANIYPFGMNDTAYSADEHSLNRAKLINYLYSTMAGDTGRFKTVAALNAMDPETLKDEVNGCWKNLTVALKWSNLYNAYTIRTKLASLRAMRGLSLRNESHDLRPLTDEEARLLAIVEHNRWNVEKLLMGYRKPAPEEDKYRHGPALGRNKELFIHHDIRPFSQLSHVSELDRELSRCIPWIMQMTEEEITAKPSEK